MPDEFSVSARLQKLEDFRTDMLQWRSAKDARDDLRHQQNLEKLESNGEKLEILLKQAQERDGSLRALERVGTFIAWLLGLLAALGVGEIFWPKK